MPVQRPNKVECKKEVESECKEQRSGVRGVSVCAVCKWSRSGVEGCRVKEKRRTTSGVSRLVVSVCTVCVWRK